MEYTKTIKGNICSIKMQGKFTFSDHGVFKDVVDVVNEGALSQIDLDLNQVEFIDSAGLGMLLLFRDEAKKAGKKLILKSPQGQVEKMFKIARFYELFEIV